MPYITIEGGELSPSQKEDLIKQITEVSSKIMKIPSDFFMVTIKIKKNAYNKRDYKHFSL